MSSPDGRGLSLLLDAYEAYEWVETRKRTFENGYVIASELIVYLRTFLRSYFFVHPFTCFMCSPWNGGLFDGWRFCRAALWFVHFVYLCDRISSFYCTKRARFPSWTRLRSYS
jgi:hypothetical protein